VRYVLSINRQGTVQQAEEILQLLEEVKSPHIVGVELSGDPRVGNWEDFRDVLDKARSQYGKKISLHCAEVEEQAKESRGMIDFKPDRLGHCIYLTKEEIAEVVEKQIPVEICPTSNMAACKTAFNQVNQLPQLQEFQRLNHNIIICCDDTMLFSTNHSSELFEYANGFKVTSQEAKDLLLRNVDAMFDDSAKEAIRE